MFCKYCGNPLAQDANFCPRCGKIVDVTVIPEQPQMETDAQVREDAPTAEPQADFTVPNPTAQSIETQPTTQTTSTQTPPVQVFSNTEQTSPESTEDAERAGSAKKILIFAILGCALSLVADIAIAGVAFSIVACCLVKRYLRKYGTTEKVATVGRSLAIAGLIVGIVLTCYSIYDLICWIITLL